LTNIINQISDNITYKTADRNHIDQPTAIQMIKNFYRNRFAEYNPFYFDLGFQFDMNSWIPIKLIKDISDYEKKRIKDIDIDIIAGDENSAEQTELFRLIADELAETHLVIITGIDNRKAANYNIDCRYSRCR
jgi:hypothetical protein